MQYSPKRNSVCQREWGRFRFRFIPVDRDGARLLFQAIDASYERRSLAITTNVDFSRWGAVLTDDQMAAARTDAVVVAES